MNTRLLTASLFHILILTFAFTTEAQNTDLVYVYPSPVQSATGRGRVDCPSANSSCATPNDYQRDAEEKERQYKQAYEAAKAQNREAIEAAENRAREARDHAEDLQRQALIGSADALAQIPVTYLNAEQLRLATEAREIAKSDLSHRRIPVTSSRKIEAAAEFQNAVESHDYETAFALAELVARGEVNQQLPTDVTRLGLNAEGVIHVEALTQGRWVGHFDQKVWNTSYASKEGEIVRRIANKYQKFLVDSNGLEALNSAQKSRYLLGIMALTAADAQLVNNQYERGSTLLSLANYVVDNITGFAVGFGQGAVEIVQSFPDLARALSNTAVATWENPVGAWMAITDFALSLPEFGAHIQTAALAYIDEFASASPYERARMVGRLTFELAIAIPTLGESAIIPALSRAESIIAFGQMNSSRAYRSLLRDTAFDRGLRLAGQKIVGQIEKVPVLARNGFVNVARTHPEAAVELQKMYSLYGSQGKIPTTQFIEKMMASEYRVSVPEIKKITQVHSDLIEKLPQVEKTSVDGVFSRGIKKGLVPDGTGGYRQLTHDDVLNLSPTNIASEHRFSIGGSMGEKAQYFAKGQIDNRASDIADELNVRSTEVLYAQTHIQNHKMLDLTDPYVLGKLNQLGLNEGVLKHDKYNFTQALGSAARTTGYDGIIFWSRFNRESKNIVLFKPD